MTRRSSWDVEAVLWGLAVTAVVLAFWPGVDMPGRAIREVAVVVAAPMLLGVRLWRGDAKLPVSLLLPIAFAGMACLGGVLGVSPAERGLVARDAMLLVSPWLICLAAAWIPSRFQLGHDASIDDSIDTAIEMAAAISLLVVAGLGLAQAWLGWSGVEQVRPPAATFVNRNVAAQVTVLLLPLAALPLLAEASRFHPWHRWLSVVATASGVAFLVATRSRGAWLGLLCGVVAVLVVARFAGARWPRVRFAPLAWTATLAVLGSLVPVQTSSGVPTVREELLALAQPTEGSTAVRYALWSNTRALVADAPWMGHGAGRFAVEYPRFQSANVPTPEFGTDYQPQHAHNDWLEYAAELGVPVTLVLVLVWALAVVACGRRAAGDDAATDFRRFAWFVALTAAGVHGLVSFPLHSPASAAVFWLVVGRGWSRVEWPGLHLPLSRPVARSAAGLLVVLAMGGLWMGAGELRARAALARALESLNASDCDEALAYASAAQEHAVWQRRTRAAAAMVVFECDARWETSLPRLETVLAENPHQLNLLLAVGSRRMKRGDFELAQAAYREAVAVVPTLAPAWTGLAMSQAGAGDRSAASASCDTAIGLAPDYAPARAFCEANGLY